MRSGRTIARTLALTAFTALLAVAGCSDARETQGQPTPSPAPEPEPTGEPHDGGRAVLAVEQPVLPLDPAGAAPWTTSQLQVARAVYDRIAVYDESYQVVPQAAARIEPNADFTEWSITLRRDLVFQDGTPLDGEALRANLEAQRQGAAAALLRPVRAVFVTGPETVNVRMRAPWSTFPHVLAGQVGFLAAPASLGAGGLPVGSGPFTAVAATDSGDLELVRNDRYRPDERARLDGLDVQVVPEAADRIEAVRQGTVDIALVDEAGPLAGVVDAEDLHVVLDRVGEAPKLTAVLDVDRLPFLDATARRAVGFATDRVALAEAGYGGLVRWVRGPVSDTSLWYNDPPILPPSPSSAGREVERFTEIYGQPLTFSVLVPTDPDTVRFAALWQRQLADAGIDAELVFVEPDQAALAAAVGAYQVVLLPLFGQWHPDLSYPALHQSELTVAGVLGPNLARFGSTAIDDALDDARTTDDLAQQVEHYRRVQNELVGGGAYLFLLRIPQAVVAAPDVHDLTRWTTASGAPGLGVEAGTVELRQVWLDRPTPATA